jgi:hypothetical protein
MIRLLFIIVLVCFIGGIASSQSGRRSPAKNSGPGQTWEDVEFQPARLIYRTVGGGGSRGFIQPWWAIDYPDAEMHFLPALNRMTKMSVSEDSRHLNAIDPELFDHPFLFLQQPGRGNWSPNEAEAKGLREYFDRGGFMIVDDFHGNYEWNVFEASVGAAFPDREIIEIPEDDSLMRVFFSLEDRLQIPGRRHVYGNQVSMDGPPHWRGIYDRRGRLEVGINFNMDMGDAWEHADDPEYPADMTGQAYRLGVNYVIYALTH